MSKFKSYGAQDRRDGSKRRRRDKRRERIAEKRRALEPSPRRA